MLAPKNERSVAMAKTTAKKKAAKRVATKKTATRKTRPVAAKPGTAKEAASAPVAQNSGDKLTFNHAMIYVKDVNRALGFYRDLLGFKLIEDFRFEGQSVYARLRAPG